MNTLLAAHPSPVPMPIGVVRKPALASVTRVASVCSSCGLRALCIPCGLHDGDLQEVAGLVYARRRVRRGQFLYRSGDRFTSLYTFRTGFFKSCLPTDSGRVHVTGFQMPGELLGLDGIEDERHHQDVIALEDAEVCVMPYAELVAAAARVPALQRHLHRAMSREIVREQGLTLLLATMRADARVAAFLLNLSQRFAARGYSAKEFNLRMTREEIGSYLGLQLETVSRVLSRFQDRGLIAAHNRLICLRDVRGLEADATAEA